MLKLLKRKKKDADVECALAGAELPSFPSVVMAALEKVRDENAPLGEIADAVSADPALSINLLGTVNSAAYGLRHEVRSVHHAVSLLGRSQVESMLIGLAVRDTLPSQHARGFDPSRFWTTAARRAVVARAIADEIAPAQRSECFTAALLQDMAVPLMSQLHGDSYGDVLTAWHNGDSALDRLESDAFGWDHATVGATLCGKWDFPQSITDAIASHHVPEPEPGSELLGSAIVAPLREKNEESGIAQTSETICRLLGFDEERAAQLLDRSFEEAESLSEMFVH